MDTVAAIATPPGAGALGVVRITGPSALPCALSFLDVEVLEPRKATFARAKEGGGTLDQVVAVHYPSSSSPTGEDLVELSAHGSPFVLKRLLEAVLAGGARLAAPGEFTRRAFLNGRMDLAQAEAVCGLIRARTQASHRAAISQLEGGLSREIARLREPILELLVQVEARLDHPEEDIPALDAGEAAAALAAMRDGISRLADTFERGRLAAEGARVCIVGRPNAGKSSLLNALLGCDRAIVCPTPGTTRDTLEEPAALGGLPAILIDTAGLRDGAAEAAEREGIERTERALRSSDLALLVIDGSRPRGPEDERVHSRILETASHLGRPVLQVINKSDLPAAERRPEDAVAVSALKGSGLEDLVRRAAETVTPPESVSVVSARHRDALERAAGALKEAQRAVLDTPALWEDRAASLLRFSLAALGEITGAGAPDEVLHAVFSRFCVGK